MIELIDGDKGVKIEPLMFSDKTSQVWQLDADMILRLVDSGRVTVNWDFESEAELIHVLQLGQLLKNYKAEYLILNTEYLPYARQDKPVTNTSTWALTTFLTTISLFYDELSALDPHSSLANDWANKTAKLVFREVRPKQQVDVAMRDFGGDGIGVAFPDHSAYLRYGSLVRDIDLPRVGSQPAIFEKTRNQLTGEVTGMKYHERSTKMIEGQKWLMIDDICDGGRTFIECAKILKKDGATDIGLYTTHGIYSKGLDVIREVGITKIYNRHGLVE